MTISPILSTVAILGGVVLLTWVLASAIRTVVVPRPERVRLTRLTFEAARRSTQFASAMIDDPVRRERWLALFGPLALLILPVLWSLGSVVAFTGIYWGLGAGSLLESFELSGSSLTTLGFVTADSDLIRVVAVSEGLLGLGIIALMISFIPTMYGIFSRREVAVGRFAVRAGEPPTPDEFILRLLAIDELDQVGARWLEWEDWFVELGETHTSFPALIYFRSIRPTRSWLTVAEAALDTAAIVISAELMPNRSQGKTMIRAGYLSLRAIADYFDVEPELDPDGPDARSRLSVSRAQFDAVMDRIEAGGCVGTADRETAWLAFAGWRINYDRAITGLAKLVGDVSSHWPDLTDTDPPGLGNVG